MPKTKSKRKTASSASDSKTKTRNSLKRTAARKAGQLKPVMTAAHQQPRSASQPTARRESKKAHIIAMLRVPGGVTIEAMARAANWQPHSVRGFLAGVVRKKLGLNYRRRVTVGASIGLRTARHLALPRPRRAMRCNADEADKIGCPESNQIVAGRRDRASARSRSPWLAGALEEHVLARTPQNVRL